MFAHCVKDKGGKYKRWSDERRMSLEVLIIVAAVFVFLPLIFTAVIFVSIVWTHRPDLTVLDILRESMKEIQEIRNTRAGEKNRQKGIRK